MRSSPWAGGDPGRRPMTGESSLAPASDRVSNATVFQLGALKVPALALGIAGSVVAHGAAVVGLYALFGEGSSPRIEQADTRYARGEPIQVRLAEPDMPEVSPEPTNADREPEMTSEADLGSLMPEAAPIEPQPAEVEAAEVLEQALTTEPTVVEPDVKPLPVPPSPPPPPPPPDWCVKLVQSVVDAVDFLERLPAPTARPRPSPTRQDAVPAVNRPETAAMPAKGVSPPPTAPPASEPRQAGVEKGAESIRLPRPDYPSRAIRRGLEGTVLVEVEVLPDGAVGEVTLHESSGHRLLDDAALRAARQGRFRPAKRDGEPVASRVIVPFEFYLR